MKRIHSNTNNNLESFDETDWTADGFVLNLKLDQDLRKKIPPIRASKVKFANKISRPSQSLIDVEKYKNLIENKNSIGDINEYKYKSWNRWIRLLNPYEKISSFSMLTKETIISRAFYKIYEIIIFFKHRFNLSTDEPIRTLHLCEAPGGFISAMKYIYPQVDWYGHTLYEGGGSLDVDVSLLDDDRWLLRNVKDKSGKYHDGDLYKLETIKCIETSLGNKKINFITADGGFDVSYDYNNQEQFSLKLIFAEILCGLHCQAIGGSFVCKIFDSMTRTTVQLVILLLKYYESVSFIKPRTSRFSNSEKYIVAVNFKGIEKKELSQLDKILTTWGDGDFCKNFGMDIDLISNIGIRIKDYNNFLVTNQSWYIHQSLCCFKHYLNEESISSKFNPNNLEALQNKRALEFCTAFCLKEKSDNDDILFKCPHTRVTKLKHESIRNVFRCNKCLNLLKNCKEI